METTKKIVQHNSDNSKRGQVVPLRTYTPRSADDLRAVLLAEAEVGRGKALANVSISAAVAAALIQDCNHGNRPVKTPMLNSYTAAMREDRWGDSAIILGALEDGLRIGDGQHRLKAQVETGTTQTYGVWVYTDQDDFQAAVRRVDARGNARNVRDLLVIEGTMPAGDGMYAEGALNTMVWFDGTMQRGTALDLDTRMSYAERRIKSLAFVASDIPKRMFRPWILGALAFSHHKDAKATIALVDAATAIDGLKAGSAAHTLAYLKEQLNAARKPSEKRRAMAIVMRLVHDFSLDRKTAKKIAAQCDATYAAVKRYAGERALVLLKADKGA